MIIAASFNESFARMWVRIPPMLVTPSKSDPASADNGTQNPMIKRTAPVSSTTPVTTRNHCGNRQWVKASTCILDPVTFPNPAIKNTNAKIPCKIYVIISILPSFSPVKLLFFSHNTFRLSDTCCKVDFIL